MANDKTIKGNEGNYFFKIPMLVIQWVFSPWENDGTIFAQVGKYFKMLFPIWEMQGTRNPHLGKGLVKVWVKFSRCRV